MLITDKKHSSTTGQVRNISTSDKISIYFQIFPYFFGEGLFLGGVIVLVNFLLQWQVFIALVMLSTGSFIIKSKLNKMKAGVRILQFGDQTIAEITGIVDAGWEHNGRSVRKYNFQYNAEDKNFTYKYKSAFKGELKIGDQFPLFYLKDDPKEAFIPHLYDVYVYK